MMLTILCGLIILLQRCLLSQATNKSQSDEPLNVFNMSATNLDSNSKYRAQMDYIQNYLLQVKPSQNNLTNQSNVTGIHRKEITNNTSTIISSDHDTTMKNHTKNPIGRKRHNISTNLLPVIYSYRGETLPTHPRIPRKTPRKRSRLNKQQLRQRRNKQGTRVFLLKPARYLLPPVVTHRIEDVPAFNFASVTPTLSTENSDSQFKEYRPTEDIQIVNSTFTRKAFIPPPLQYLLPPFYDDNDVRLQPSTTENTPPNTTTSNNNYEPYFAREDAEQYQSQPEYNDKNNSNENVFRIIEPNNNQNTEEPTTNAQKETIHRPFSNDYNTEEYVFQQTEAHIDKETSVAKIYPTARYSVENPTVKSLESYANSTIKEENLYTERNEHGKFMIKVDPNHSIKQNSNDFYITSPDSMPNEKEPTTSYPIITGRNIEKELFESGLFQDFDTTTIEPITAVIHHKDTTTDIKMSMFNKPLLSEEVEKAGMKIVVSNQNITPVKKWEDVRHSSRGRYKYKHFNQFQFDKKEDRPGLNSRPTSKSSSKGRSLQLSVAETNYYTNRRISEQQEFEQREVQVIPGVPGKDYPTLTKPPSSRNFSCKNLAGGRGYYGDTSTGCQVFYVCVGDGAGEPMLCPNGTLFSQDYLVCDWWYNVDCRENVIT